MGCKAYVNVIKPYLNGCTARIHQAHAATGTSKGDPADSASSRQRLGIYLAIYLAISLSIYIYIYMLSLSLSLSLSIYIYIYMYVCIIYIYIHIYIYIYVCIYIYIYIYIRHHCVARFPESDFDAKKLRRPFLPERLLRSLPLISPLIFPPKPVLRIDLCSAVVF